MDQTAAQTLEDRSQFIAMRSNGNEVGMDDLYRLCTELYKHESGWFLIQHGGAAMFVDRRPDWHGRDEAIHWIATQALDPVTGYGYTREQAEIMVDGGDAGKGYRSDDD